LRIPERWAFNVNPQLTNFSWLRCGAEMQGKAILGCQS
jgi:hypothetical protein